MRITIVGAGPAGLYFALLAKKQDPRHQIVVVERDPPGATYGWGIVFSDRTLSFLHDHDVPTYESITRRFVLWDNVDVVHRGERVTVRGNRFAGISRVAFLEVLRRRCEGLGIEFRYRQAVSDEAALPPSDLVVGADGANSVIRRAHAAVFLPSVDRRRNRYIWLGTRRIFQALTLTFRESAHGAFVAHSYKFGPDASTFIVEAVGEAWTRAGFEGMTAEATCAYLEQVFADDLEGHPLLTNDYVRWQTFSIVSNGGWSDGNVVLLGDALHTTHFSVGSGTKAALEDAIALSEAMGREPEVTAALADFTARRKPVVEALQAAAQSSLLFFEEAESRLGLHPLDLAYDLMTRSGRIDDEGLRKRDPEFMARVLAHRAGRA
jgi:anthraniloyl-CoA monooxygenase